MTSKRFSIITQEEFEQLFEEYFDGVTSFLYTYASSDAELKDWVQEVFIKLWLKRSQIDFFHPSFKSYLFKTARNHALKKLQREKNYGKWLEENLIRITELHSPTGKKERHLSPTVTTAYHEALSKIPSRALQTWKLSREDGFTYSEIAKIMNVSLKTVESQISTALRILRDELRNIKL